MEVLMCSFAPLCTVLFSHLVSPTTKRSLFGPIIKGMRLRKSESHANFILCQALEVRLTGQVHLQKV